MPSLSGLSGPGCLGNIHSESDSISLCTVYLRALQMPRKTDLKQILEGRVKLERPNCNVPFFLCDYIRPSICLKPLVADRIILEIAMFKLSHNWDYRKKWRAVFISVSYPFICSSIQLNVIYECIFTYHRMRWKIKVILRKIVQNIIICPDFLPEFHSNILLLKITHILLTAHIKTELVLTSKAPSFYRLYFILDWTR